MPSAGAVEVRIAGEWGAVCTEGWGNMDAYVLCKMMGFESGRALTVTETASGECVLF